MTQTTEQTILSTVSDTRERVVKIESGIFGEDGHGRLPVAENRLNDHAARLQSLEQMRSALPCVSHMDTVAKLAKRVGWLERIAWLTVGGGVVIAWELNKLLDVLKLILPR